MAVNGSEYAVAIETCGAGWSVGVNTLGAVIESDGSGNTVRVKTVEVADPAESCTRMVSEYVPAVVGGPASRPAALNVSPGTVPEASVHVRAPDPPPTANDCEYGTPTTALGNEVGVILAGGFDGPTTSAADPLLEALFASP